MAFSSVVFAAVLILSFYNNMVWGQNEICSMTPRTLQSDFVTSCNNITSNEARCEVAWDAFRDAFAQHDPANVTASDYQPYFDIFPISDEVMTNQSLFWSRTFSLVEEIEMINMMTMMGATIFSSVNVISSKIINNIQSGGSGLSWCGSTDSSDGIDFTNNCSCDVTTQFWTQFSREFARSASGVTFYMGDGESMDGAFRNNSFFATEELPFMPAGVVTHVVALVIHEKGKGEACSDTSGSLAELKRRVTERSFSYSCYDIYGNASDSSQTATVARCAAGVISQIQQGKEPDMMQIDCDGEPDGAGMLQMSFLLLFITSIFQYSITI